MRKRASKGGIERLSEERKALAELYTMGGTAPQRREHLVEVVHEADKQACNPASTRVVSEAVTEPPLRRVLTRPSTEASEPPASTGPKASHPHALFSVRSRCFALLGFTVIAAACYATDWHSPVRVAVTALFLLFVPGLALAELAPLAQAVERLVVGIGASLAFETLVAVAFLYAGFFTPGRVFAVALAATAGFAAVAAFRGRQPS